jgi:hypothetical protein
MKTFSKFKIDILDEEDLDEKVVKREKKTAQQKRDQKMKYRKNKNKIKMRQKKYKKSSGYKLLQKKKERMKKMGKTATGRDISVGAGAGAEKRRSELQKKLRK